jgi:beta-lactamase regulating signal transducer with metallopeptidase domain
MIDLLNHIGHLWWDWTASMFWQVSLLILLIGCIDRLIRRWAWPQLRYALWSLILVKLILPPSLSLPSGVVSGLQPRVAQALRWMSSDKPALTSDCALRIAHSNISAGPQFSVSAVADAGSQPLTGKEDTVNTELNVAGNPQLQWQFYALTIWFLGTLTLGTGFFLRLLSMAGRYAYEAATASLPPSFYNHLADCSKRLGLRRIPRVVVTERLTSPAVFGVLLPVVLVPKGYLSKLSRQDTEHVLLHELAHIKRGDLVMHSLYLLLQTVYWYQPLLWLVRRHLHHLRELSCDGTVAELLRERTPAYRQMLLETARRMLVASVEPGLGLLGLFEDSNHLLVRLNWLTKPTWRYCTMKRTIVATIAVLMFLCVLPMAQARESAPRDGARVRPRAAMPVRTIGDNQQAQDRLSQEIAALEAKLAQLRVQQQDVQKQLAALTGQSYQPQDDHRAPAVRREGARGRLPRQRASGDVRAQGAPREPMAGRGGGAPGTPKVAGRDEPTSREPMARRGGGAPGRSRVAGRDSGASGSQE